MSEHIELELKNPKEWIEMFPYGLTAWSESDRPVMIFKDKKEQRVLPVWLSPIDAGIAVTESRSDEVGPSPHALPARIFKELEVRPQKCFFTKLNGQQQYVRIEFEGSDKLTSLESRADEAISFCLHQKTKFFATSEYIENCRQVDMELQGNKHAVRTPLQRQRDRYLN